MKQLSGDQKGNVLYGPTQNCLVIVGIITIILAVTLPLVFGKCN